MPQMKEIPFEILIAKARRSGKSVDGLIVIEMAELRRVASELGGALPLLSKRTADYIRDQLRGRKLANGSDGARWGFEPAALDLLTKMYGAAVVRS